MVTATQGQDLITLQVFNLRAGLPTDATELVASYCVIAFGGLAMSFWFFRHCRG